MRRFTSAYGRGLNRPTIPAPEARLPTSLDRWYLEPALPRTALPSRVEVVRSAVGYQLLVNGEPRLIRGMGLNSQYAIQLDPADRVSRLDADFQAFRGMGVNLVTGWEPREFDEILLDRAAAHGLGVVLPFDLDPAIDYEDAGVRAELTSEVVAWVTRFRSFPALHMWGLGNEVLHKIVHPSWIGTQDPVHARKARAFAAWLVETADLVHALDPDHPVTYRAAEDAFVSWIREAVDQRGGGPRPWFVFGINCYQVHLSTILQRWPEVGLDGAIWVSEFAPGGLAIPDRPDGFRTLWGYIRQHPDYVLGGAVYAWTRNGPEGIDRNLGLTDDGTPVDGRSLEALAELFTGEQ
jgi:beta-galactosidase/beta-glucuronidase